MKKIYKIVFTGAPCGGKTECIRYTKSILEDLGYRVLIIKESSTELYEMGLRTTAEGELETFNQAFLDSQLFKEKLLTQIANTIDNNQVAILSDRGIMDVAVYMGHDAVENYLKKKEIVLSEVVKHYDGVIHLHTVAERSDELYMNLCGTNPYRGRIPQKSRQTDPMFSKMWGKYVNVFEIEACEYFEEKLDKLRRVILEIVKQC